MSAEMVNVREVISDKAVFSPDLMTDHNINQPVTTLYIGCLTTSFMSLSDGAISIPNGLHAAFPSFRLHIDCYSHMITTVTKKRNVQKDRYSFQVPDSALSHIESQSEKDALSVSIKRFVFNELYYFHYFNMIFV